MERLKRKIDEYLIEWKKDEHKLPLIIKGARQIGKTNAIRNFGKNNYKTYIEINFALQPQFKTIFEDGFEVDNIIKNITLKLPEIDLNENNTLIFFDEMQECVSTATSLKAFKEDGRYDVICSGSLMGINYKEIESNSVGNKEDYIMRSLDFEEFLWAKGYKTEQIGFLIGSLDEETQEDLRNMNTYKGALYENIVGDMLVKAGYQLYFYKDDSKKIEMDFMIRDKQSLIPVEVKANNNATISFNNLINNNLYKDIKYGIKLCNKNIGFNGKFYTFPYFLTFLLKRFLEEKK